MRISATWRCCALALALFTAGCGQSPEQIVTGTRHCTEVTLTDDVMMRLSSYQDYPDSISVWVAQLCHPTGTACTPVLTYDHAPSPVYSMEGDTIRITLLGGKVRSHVETAKTGRAHRIITETITGDVGQRDIAAFQQRIRHRCPPENQTYPR